MLLSSCVTKPSHEVRADERACLVAILLSEDVNRLSIPNVKTGDVVLTGWCAERFVRDMELEILRATK